MSNVIVLQVFEESSQYTTLRETGLGHFCMKYIHMYYRLFTPNNAILSHLFLEHSASLSVCITTDVKNQNG